MSAGRKGQFSNPAEGNNMSDEYEFIFVRYITTRSGRRIYAAAKGLRAFRIRVRKKRKLD